jgi:hypothetical protein
MKKRFTHRCSPLSCPVKARTSLASPWEEQRLHRGPSLKGS